jgi:D-alanyl-lipoteichoic acid acyltransferase DltB (MBOAT superfamily)
MLFSEQSFLFYFLPAVFVGVLFLRLRSSYLTNWWIILASFFFYGFHGWQHLPLLILSILVNYGIGFGIEKRAVNRSGYYLLILGIVCNLLILATYKYADFITSSFHFDYSLNLTLPLAISFFTFQQIAYLVDLRKGKMTTPSFTHYITFISFFPQLIAGPIVRCQEMVPQLQKGLLGKLSSKNFWSGICLFSIGLFKKSCLADGIRPLVDAIFSASSNGITLSTAEAWVAVLSFGLQIYFDFSAYSEMALGLGLILGLRLPLNFDSPYKAVNILDFWRRWHITLSEFLRDYLYKPLGGNRLGVYRGVFNVLLVMLLGGLWHGAGLTYIIWGFIHGCMIGFYHFFRSFTLNKDRKKSTLLHKLLASLITFMTVNVAWVFFRSENMDSAFGMIKSLIGLNGISLPRSFDFLPLGELVSFIGFFPNQAIDLGLLAFLPVLLAIVWFAPNAYQLLGLNPKKDSYIAMPPFKTIFLCGLLLFFGIKVSFETLSYDFIYFRF